MSVTDLPSGLSADHAWLARQAKDVSDTLLTIARGHGPHADGHAGAAARITRSRLFVRRLQMDARIGVYDHEKERVQPVIVDLEFGLRSEKACHSDRLGDSVDYSAVVARLRALAQERHHELVESLAEAMAAMLQREFGVPWLTLSLAKPTPFPGAEVGITLERGQRA